MEIVTSLICSSSTSCCSDAASHFWFFKFFFFSKVFACRLVICRMSRTGIEKCAVKWFQTHGGSDNESPKLSLPANTFLIPSTTRALLLLYPHPPTARSSEHQDQKRRGILQFPGIPGSSCSLPGSPPTPESHYPRRAWDSTGHLAGIKSDEGNSDVTTARFNKISSPLCTTHCGSLTPLLMISTHCRWQGSEQCPLC